MGRTTEANKIGDVGEHMAATLLSRVAIVNRCERDIGLDFHCELREKPMFEFYVQAKGSESPTYTTTKKTISSLSVECETIEKYWCKKLFPVFVFMSDITRNKTYYTIVDEETYKPSKEDQDTYTFSIPLSNEVTLDNIGKFRDIVVERQPNLSQEDLKLDLDEYYRKHPELYHDLDELDQLLEVMRGSDQEAQMEVRLLLKRQVEAGIPVAGRLRDGLTQIFINCKDRITQNHALKTLVSLGESSIIPEILRQIDRNIHLYEYRRHNGQGWRSPYTDFLFYALVELQATSILPDLKRFLSIKDIAVNLNAMQTCGRLKLDGAIEDIIPFLGHPDDWVRYQASQALSQLSSSRVNRKLENLFEVSQDALQIAGIVQALAEQKNDQVEEEVLRLADNPNRNVRRSVALYLGAVDPIRHASRLLHMLVEDEDHKVRTAALQSIHQCLPTEYPEEFDDLDLQLPIQNPPMRPEELEKLALPLLQKAFADRQVLQMDSLLPFCKGKASVSILIDIYLDSDLPRQAFEFLGPTGELESTREIHLKPVVLNILKQYNPLRIRADVVEQIESADPRERHYYIAAAGEMKLDTAFEPITTLIEQNGVQHRHFVVSSLLDIDKERARRWASDTLRSNPSLETSLVCFDIIHQAGEDQIDRDLITEQILCLMEIDEVRQTRQIYDYVDRYQVVGASPLIVDHLRTGPSVELPLALRMFKTLAALKTEEGRDVLIEAMQVNYIPKRPLIEYLSEIGDSESMQAITEYRDDPDPEVNKLVERILADAENTG